jgi:SRSO17 transposase
MFYSGMSSDQARQNRLTNFTNLMADSLGHADRRTPCTDYLHGLLLPGDRKSMEPIAARIDERHTAAKHQSLQHFISDAPWNERPLLDAARDYALPFMEQCGGVSAWVIDDTGIPKKGTCSVGVARQYCGVLGKQDNCQVAVSVSLANERMGLPVAWRLYLPEAWANDPARRKKAKIPESITFRTKMDIALDEIDRLIAAGVPDAPILADAGYGKSTEFREALTTRGKLYAVGVIAEQGLVTVPSPGSRRAPRRGSCEELALSLPAHAWQTITWREGSQGPQRSRFAAIRVRATHKVRGSEPVRPPEWLIIEWPENESKPTKYSMSTLPESWSLKQLVRLIKLRWRIERDYEDLKGELGLDHFEGRSWRGFHHHGALCMAAFSFIAAERVRGFPPSRAAFLPAQRQRPGYRPRGSPAQSH